MRKAILAAVFSSVVSIANAAVIEINYTGTYTASWDGNYDPGGVPVGVNDFQLSFSFDTSVALPGNLSSNQVRSFEPFQGTQLFPSVGYGSFSSGGIVAGNYFASHTVGLGST